MKVARLFMSVIALALVATACGEDTVEPEEGLTKEEAVALFKSMKTVQADTALQVLFSSEDSTVVACPRGGQAKLILEFETDSIAPDTVRWGTIFLVTPRGCKQVGDGMEFTVDGDPSVRDEVSILFINAFPAEQTGSFTGGVRWELEDRSGGCAIDMTLSETKVDDSDPDNPVLRQVHEGTLCGYESEVELITPIEIT